MIQTSHLVLRPLRSEDAPALAAVAGARRVADTTISVPHPFGPAEAEDWIGRRIDEAAAGRALGLAMTLAAGHGLIGYVGLHHIDREHLEAEISFWIGGAHEGRGLVKEAADAVIGHGFGTLGLNRICAYHMARNPDSERVLARLGFQYEGRLRQRVRKWEVFEDVLVCSRLRSDPEPQGEPQLAARLS
jgi:ribosomal-protein-alanine N-acetyltransferase